MINLILANKNKGKYHLVNILYIMEFTGDRIDNDKNIVLSLLKLFSMFKIKFWWNPGEYEIKYTGIKITIRCGNFGKETMIYVGIMNTKYQDIITTFVLNTMLHHVGMLWINKTHEQLKYDVEEQNSEWMTGFLWYNTSICKKIHLRGLLEMQELTDIISCDVLMQMKMSISHLVIVSAAVGVVHFKKIHQ